MKRKVIAAVIGAVGVAGLATSSYGQGSIAFNTYGSTGYYPVSYSAQSMTALGLANSGAKGNVDAELGFFIGTSSNPTDFTLMPSSITAVNGTLLANGGSSGSFNGSGAAVTGFIQGLALSIPGYSAGPISFEILAWVASGNGAGGGTFANSGFNGSFIWTESSIPAGVGTPAGFFQNLTGNAVLNPTAPVPEPTTLALAGLGGLASLVALRRKKA
jgi:hypothetical protein